MLWALIISSFSLLAQVDVDFEGVSTEDHDINISGESTGSVQGGSGNFPNSLYFPRDKVTEVLDAEATEDSIGGRPVSVSSGGNFRERFDQLWQQCGKGCTLVNPWVAGDAAHCRRASCHNSRQAIDIHTVNCRGRVYKQGLPDFKLMFSGFAACMKRANSTTVLWQIPAHYGHIHVNFAGCLKRRGCGGQSCLEEEGEYVL